MHPSKASIRGHQCGTGKLQNVAVLLERSPQADRKARSLGRSSTPAAFRRREKDARPIGAFETHRTVALPLGVRDAYRRHAVPPAEARHLLGSSLDHAAHSEAALFELRKRLAQLRECLRIKRSAKMPQPHDQREPASPQFGKEMRLTGSRRVTKLRRSIPDGRRAFHAQTSLRKIVSILTRNVRPAGAWLALAGVPSGSAMDFPRPLFPLALLQEKRYPLSCRSERGTRGATTHRSAAGHTRSSDPEDPGARAAARLGHFRARPADFPGCAAAPAGVALSRSAPAGAPRVDQSALGDLRQ
jgi:hypothetical protein